MIMALAKHGINSKLHKAASEVDKNGIDGLKSAEQKKNADINFIGGETCKQTLI